MLRMSYLLFLISRENSYLFISDIRPLDELLPPLHDRDPIQQEQFSVGTAEIDVRSLRGGAEHETGLLDCACGSYTH